MARVHRGDPLSVPNQSLHSYLFQCMEKHGDKICLVDKGTDQTLTFAQVMDQAILIGQGLQTRGLEKGDIVLFCKNNSASIFTVMLGAMAVGAQICFITPASTTYELEHYVQTLGTYPKFVITEMASLDTVKEVMKHRATFVVDGEADKSAQPGSVNVTSFLLTPKHNTIRVYHPRSPKTTPVLILFSSGTTGKQKCVMLSHTNIVAAIESGKSGVIAPGYGLATFPMYHIAGLMASCIGPLVLGYPVVLYPRFDFVEFLEAIQTYRPEKIIVPPPLLVLMTKTPLVRRYNMSSVRQVMVGAAVTKAEVEDAFKMLFNNPSMQQIYGMTEMCGCATASNVNLNILKAGSVGKVLPGLEAKIVDPDTTEMIGANKPGEVWLRGPQVMLGYMNNPEATRQTVDEDGWLHTGDLAYYDEEDYFFVVDRIKELVKYKGFQVAPAELDAVLLEHPDVADAGVTGKPDAEAGELPCAFVVKKPGSNLTETDVHNFIKERVSYYKFLRGGVYFVDAIPKLPSGKILRRSLRDMLIKSKL